jgi:DNA-directed RNA polymerase specialized sigma24 family protein
MEAVTAACRSCPPTGTGLVPGRMAGPGTSAPGDEAVRPAATAQDVRAALGLLSAERRQVIVEMYFRGHSAAETARLLGVPEGIVRSRSYYGLRQLRRTIPPRAAGLDE